MKPKELFETLQECENAEEIRNILDKEREEADREVERIYGRNNYCNRKN